MHIALAILVGLIAGFMPGSANTTRSLKTALLIGALFGLLVGGVSLLSGSGSLLAGFLLGSSVVGSIIAAIMPNHLGLKRLFTRAFTPNDMLIRRYFDEANRGRAEISPQVREDLMKRVSAVKEKGTATFKELAYAYQPQDPVVILKDNLRHGALVDEVHILQTMFGPILQVEYKFVTFDGEKFVYTDEKLYIPYFEGEKAFTELPVQHMSEAEMETLATRGAYFHQVNAKREQAEYKGNIVRRTWAGPRLFRADGRVIVDVKSFTKLDPNYDGFYGSLQSREEANMQEKLTLACCSPYVYGFSFARKLWGEITLDSMSPAQYRKDAFDRVVLEPARKKVIRALVDSEAGQFTDIISGKGGGLIFLLSGPPGVGKTVTAEAIAETLERPLYMVGAGELGTEAGDVEEKLRDILDTAAMWNAVLLIDECDIFLEKRTKDDIKRNALVAIFLRMLEYYPGILFLTTNRVNELDEAFLSRISVAMHYPKLAVEKRLSIWKDLAGAHGFENLDFEALSKRDLNGREIKHCLRLALKLANFEKRKATQEDIEQMIALGQEFRDAGAEGEEGAAAETAPPTAA